MFGKKHSDNGEKIYRYSIRKYHFGAASVAVAALMFFANGVQAQAPAVSPVTASDVVAGPSGNSDGDPQDSDEESPEKTAVVEQPVELKSAGESSAPEAKTEEGSQEESEAEVKSPQPETKIDDKEEVPQVAKEKDQEVSAPVADTSAAKSIQSNLEALLANLTLDSMKALRAEVEEALAKAKAVLENPKATQAQVDEQVKLMEDLIRRVREALSPQVSTPPVLEKAGLTNTRLATPEGAVTNQGGRGKRRKKGDLSQATPAVDQTSPETVGNSGKTESSEKPSRQELPTYSNQGDGAYKLKDELEFIYKRLQKEGVEESKIQAVKAAADKFNEAFSKGDTISQDAFDAALVDLKKSRDLIEGVLESKYGEDATTRRVNIEPRDGGEELPNRGRGRTRTTRTVREGTENYDNSRESFFEDGKKGNSPYDKYTYVFYSRRQVGAIDNANRRVEEARNQIYADVTPTDTGFKWDIYINRSKYDLSDAVGWFTIPNGQNLKSGSVDISWKSNEGEHATSPNDGTISGALREAGFRNVTEGTPQHSGVSKEGNSTVNKKYNSSNLYTLSHTGGTTGQNPYKKNLENGAEKGLAEAKFDIINNSNGKLFYFELNRDLKTYHLSFETIGSNNINTLAYAVGMKGERQDDDNDRLRTRFLVNQWYARTKSELDTTDKVKFKVAGRGYFKINQHTAYVNFISDSQYIGRQIYREGDNVSYNYPQYIENPLNPDTKGVLTYSRTTAAKDSFDIDITSYGTYENENGQPFEKQKGKSKAEQNGQKFDLFTTVDGHVRNLTRKELTLDAISTPGVHTYRYNRSFTDGSHDTGTFNFVTKPKKPTLTTNLERQAGKIIDIKAGNGTNGFDMRLYKRAANGSLTEVLGANGKPLTAKAGSDGVATFNNVKVEEADYVVKTVVEGKWIDYDNTRHSTVESDESDRKTATDGVPPVVRIAGVTLPETSPSDAIYTVTQGQPFAPNLEAFDNTGKITKFELRGDLPTGVNLSSNVSSTDNYTEASPYRPTFTGDVPTTMEPGVYTRTITVNDGKTGDKTYYFKYKVLPKAPTITTEAKYGGTLVSTDRSISGTGHPGATITVTLQDGTTTGTTKVNAQGNWTYTLRANEKLTQNFKQDASIKMPNSVSIKQTKNDAESEATTVKVQLARAISIDTPVQAGREITVRVPHDTGKFYVQVNYETGQEYEYGVQQVNGQWRITDSNKANITELRVSDGSNISEKVLTFRVKDSNKKNNIPFTIPAEANKIRLRVHYDNRPGNPADPGQENSGWVVASPATNTAPSIAVKDSNATYTANDGLTKDKLKTFVTVTDAEDDADKTVGATAKENLDVTVTKNGQSVDLSNNKSLKQGTYTLRYTTRDAAGASVTKEHTLKVNYTVQARATINLVQGENVSDELKRSLVQLRDGNDVIDVPRNARVDVAVDTSAKTDSNKQAQATVVLADGTRLAPVTLSYRVLPTFPIAHTVYDFKNVARSDNESGYYVNTGNLPGGMVWVAKRGSEQEKNASELKGMLASDPLGETTYKFGGKYNYGRFTNSPQATEKLEHTDTLTHKVFDIEANPTKVTVEKGATLTEQNAKDSVTKVTGSANLPDGTTYEWVGTPDTNTPGVRTYKVRVTLPVSQTGQNQPDATQKRPFKIIDVKVNVKPEQPTVKTTIQPKGNIRIPTVSSTDRELTGTGLPNAKVKVNVSGTELNEVTVGRDGTWRVTLPKGLKSNQLNQRQLVQGDTVRVKQIVDGVESDTKDVPVSLGATTIQPSEQGGNSLYAGAKTIVIKTPHDAGIAYVKYIDNKTGAEHELGLKRETVTGPWVSKQSNYGVVRSYETDNFIDTITVDMNEAIKESTPNNQGNAQAIANIFEGSYSSATDWKAISVTNQAPTITGPQGDKKTVEHGSTLTESELKTFVTVHDTEDDKGLTRGTKVHVDVVSVNDNTGNKTINTNQPGSYTVKYKAVDSQGKESVEKTVTVEVKPQKPMVNPLDNGDVTISNVNQTNVDRLEVTYTPNPTRRLQDNGNVAETEQARTTIVATKGTNNQWTITQGEKDGISISNTGELTLKDSVVKDLTSVEAKVLAQNIASNVENQNAKAGDKTGPVIDANSTLIGVGKQLNIPLTLSDGNGVGVDESNIKVTNLPNGLTYDSATRSIKGSLGSVAKHDITVRVLDKNGNKAEKIISIAAVKAKPIYAIKDGTIDNVDTPSNFVEMPKGVTLTAAWKDGNKPTTAAVGNTTKTVMVSANGYTSTEVDVPVTVYPGVTYRKVNNKEVTEYDEIVGQPLTSRLVPGGGSFNPVTPDYYIAFEGGTKPEGTRVEFEGGTPAERSTAAGVTTKTIVVTYPHGAGTVKKTVTFKTYGNEANYETGKNSIETTVGTEFSKLTARNSVKLSDPNVPNPNDTFIGWWKNGRYTPENKIGKRNENVNVWYGSNVESKRGDNTHNYSDQNIPVNVTVKPQAPTIATDAFHGKGATKPAVTVSNIPTSNQLEGNARVTVELYQGGTKVASKELNSDEITRGAGSVRFDTDNYTSNLTLGEKVHAVVKVEGGSGTTAYNLSSANSNDVQVTPQKPTFDATAVTSTSRTLSGTLGGFDDANKVVEVHLNDEKKTVLSSADGRVTITGDKWTAKLPDNVKLRQSVAKNGETAKPSGIIVENKVAGTTISTTSDAKEVAMGAYSVSPAIAGSKHIDITVPHDAKRVELRFHNSVEIGDKANSIVLVRGADGTWHTEATRADNTTVTDASGYVGRISSSASKTNPAENVITIPLNEESNGKKLHIREEAANGDTTATYGKGLGLRVEYQPEAGQDPTAAGNWKVANVTNTAPVLAHKGTEGSTEANRKVYPSRTSITKEMLAELVTVTDPEDNATDVNNKPYGSPTIEIVSGLTETPGKATAPDIYTVTLKATDSQGRESNELTVYVEVRKQRDENDPTAKEPNQSVSRGVTPVAKDSVNTDNLPEGTT
ncbi:Ig-like domain-containing protein, partial [Streptococcus sp.]